MVAAETSNEASACLTCCSTSRSSILAMRWFRRTVSASRTLMVSRRPLTLGTTCTVAAPIRLPTTVTYSASGARETVASATVMGGRGPPPPRPPNPPPNPPAASAAGRGPAARPAAPPTPARGRRGRGGRAATGARDRAHAAAGAGDLDPLEVDERLGIVE